MNASSWIGPMQAKVRLQAITAEDVAPVGYIYGDLKALFPAYTFSELNDVRAYNWNLFKGDCNSKKLSGRTAIIDGERLEIYVPPSDSVTMAGGTSLTVAGKGQALTQIYCYPIAPNEGQTSVIFTQEYGSNLKFTGLTLTRESGTKYETYSCVLKKSSNPKLVEILGTIRPEFWTNMHVGDTFFYGWAISVKGESNTIASWDSGAKTVTLTNNISAEVTNNMSGSYVKCGVYFEQSIGMSTYNTYGQAWALYEGFTFIYSLQTWISQPDAVLVLDQIIFSNADKFMDYYSGAIKMYLTNTYFTGCQIALSVFSSNVPNNQQVHIDNVTFESCGYLIAGGIAFSTANNFLGSGAYIHPSIAVKKIGTGRLNLLNNNAAAFRQYSASGPKPVALGSTTEFGIVTCSSNTEYDLLCSSSMPVTIDKYVTNTGGRLLVGNNFYLNEGEVFSMELSIHSEPDGTDDYDIVLNDCIITGPNSFSWGAPAISRATVSYIGCTFVTGVRLGFPMLIQSAPNKIKAVNVIGGSMVIGPSGGIPYAIGTPIASLIDGTRLVGHWNIQKLTITDFITEKIYSALLQFGDQDYYPSTLLLDNVEINNCDIKTYQLILTGNNGYHSFIVDSNDSIIEGPASVQRINTKVAKVSTSLVNVGGYTNVLKVLTSANEYDFSGGGTVNLVGFSGLSKTSVITDLLCTDALNNPIIVNAIGANITFSKFLDPTNLNSNILNDYTCLAGQSCLITPDINGVTQTGVDALATITIATGDGSTKIFVQNMADIFPKGITGSSVVAGAVVGAIDINGNVTGAGIVEGFFDLKYKIWSIEFAVAPTIGVPIDFTYMKIGGPKFRGVVTISAYP